MSDCNATDGPVQLNPHGPHVAVLAFPFSSHASSLLSVVRRLASAPSASATLFSFFSTHKSNRSLFTTNNSDHRDTNIKAYDVTDGAPEGYVFQGKPEEGIGLFLQAAPDAFRKGMEAAAAESGRRITCVFADAFLWFAEEIAAAMEVPTWIPFFVAGPLSLAAHLYTDLIRERLDVNKGITGREEERLEFIPGMSKMQLKDLPEGVLFGNLDSTFSRMLLLMGRSFPRATAVVIKCFEELDPALIRHLESTTIPNLLSIRPQQQQQISRNRCGNDEYGCLTWLDNRKAPASVAYIGFGTLAVLAKSEMVAIAEALEATRVPFIWSLKKELWDRNLPEGFLNRTRVQGIVVPWAPQVDILSHEAVGVFVNHAGWGSLLEVIVGGVPMICRPFIGDNWLNGRMIQDVLEVGVMVDGGTITGDSLATNLGLILTGEIGRRMREKVKYLRRQTSVTSESSTENFNKLLKIITTKVEEKKIEK